ncbi:MULTISPECIES: PGF-CTERM-anchored ABC transporter substrate-binding protein [Halorussus]|uniref:PGF-CTERM-anchored ABC transporter substrate-binding protein n=1 Tax=Halorussus TaxID=1070314 RepID=UPI000E2192AE|nr:MULTISPECIES: PGF-CTERM-anchored ABC transporter substrate-binding protein [Halorussus]NHN58177.1 ABC transporter substrate-binding protein [Halorussus sp. JP-T4]
MRRKVTSLFAVLLLLVAAGGVSVGAAPVGAAGGSAAVAAQSTTTQSDCSFPVAETDATGTEVTVEQRPERIVTLSPSAAQTMWEIGGESQVVGVSQYATYLKGAASRTNVSGAGQTQVNVEKVVAAEPDLVLAPNVITNQTVQRLREAGLTVFRFGFATSVEDIYAKTELTGQLTGNCEGADETVASMRKRVETVQEAVENSERPSVFISVGGGWTAGNGTFVSNMIELAGGNNVAAAANVSGYGQISEEVIVQQDPEWIVQLGQYGAYPRTEAYNNTAAVRNDRVVTVSDQHISQPAPRVVDGIVKLAKAFHPEAYADANATTTMATTESPETTTEPMRTSTDAPGTTTEEGAMRDQDASTTTTESSDGGVPGFGVPAALAALAGAALLARRR